MTLRSLIYSALVAASCVTSYNNSGPSLFESWFSLPEYARREVVYPKNKDVIFKVNAIISLSDNLGTMQRRVAGANWPDKVFHVEVRQDLEDLSPAAVKKIAAMEDIEPYSERPWTGLKTVVRNGSGYGAVLTSEGQQNVVIVDGMYLSKKKEKVRYTIYIKRPRDKTV
jgi:hypothetical protein